MVWMGCGDDSFLLSRFHRDLYVSQNSKRLIRAILMVQNRLMLQNTFGFGNSFPIAKCNRKGLHGYCHEIYLNQYPRQKNSYSFYIP